MRSREPCYSAGWLQALDIEPLQVGIIGRLTEVVLITTGSGRMHIVSPHELPTGRT
jgi:hypothetical protein